MTTSMKSDKHYCNSELIDQISSGLKQMGKSTHALTIDDFMGVDEFHVKGAKATHELIKLLQPKADSKLIDLGSGLGGPARRFADITGCHVTGVDLSGDFCSAAQQLSQWIGMDDNTDFIQGSVTDLAEHHNNHYDGAYSIHVAMNIEDRHAFYSEAARVLKSGARFVNYDIVLANGHEDVSFPMPWSHDAESSFLKTETQMLLDLEQAGFTIESTHDDSSHALEFLQTTLAKVQQEGPAPLSLVTVIGPVARQALPNLTQHIAAGKLRVLTVSAIK